MNQEKDPNLATLVLNLSYKTKMPLKSAMDKADNLVREYEGGTPIRYAKYSAVVGNPSELRQFDNHMYAVLNRFVDIYGAKNEL